MVLTGLVNHVCNVPGGGGAGAPGGGVNIAEPYTCTVCFVVCDESG